MPSPIPIPNVTANNTASSSASAKGSSDGSFIKSGDFIVGKGASKGLEVPWYVWAAVSLAAVLWAKKKA